MCLKLSDFSESLVQHYNLEEKATRDGYLYVENKKGGLWSPTSTYHCAATATETTE